MIWTQDGGSFSELSDSDTCGVNSPFCCNSSSKEEEVIQAEPDRRRNRTRWTLPKHANTYSELGWKEQIQTVQKPAFSGIKLRGLSPRANYTNRAAAASRRS